MCLVGVASLVDACFFLGFKFPLLQQECLQKGFTESAATMRTSDYLKKNLKKVSALPGRYLFGKGCMGI